MAGETIRTEAICLRIHPWSRTSHIVEWLTPEGPVKTVVKGAVRPKSAFLGQYDLNYTCGLLYYARGRGGLHPLRECWPLDRRDALRGDYRALALADRFRALAAEFAPTGPEARDWFGLLARSLDALASSPVTELLAALADYELAVLRLMGLGLEFAVENGALALRGDRSMPVSEEVSACLRDPRAEKNPKILLETARVIGVYYTFHLEMPPEDRRSVLKLISTTKQESEKTQ